MDAKQANTSESTQENILLTDPAAAQPHSLSPPEGSQGQAGTPPNDPNKVVLIDLVDKPDTPGAGWGIFPGAAAANKPKGCRLCVLVEGTAAIASYWREWREEFLEPVLKQIERGVLRNYELSLVIFRTPGIYSDGVLDRSGWTNSVVEFREWLDDVKFVGGGGRNCALAEGLAEVIYLSKCPSGLGEVENLQQHCLTFAVSDVHRLPFEWPYSGSVCVESHRALGVSMAGALAHHGLSWSVITAKKSGNVYKRLYTMVKLRDKQQELPKLSWIRNCLVFIDPRWQHGFHIISQQMKTKKGVEGTEANPSAISASATAPKPDKQGTSAASHKSPSGVHYSLTPQQVSQRTWNQMNGASPYQQMVASSPAQSPLAAVSVATSPPQQLVKGMAGMVNARSPSASTGLVASPSMQQTGQPLVQNQPHAHVSPSAVVPAASPGQTNPRTVVPPQPMGVPQVPGMHGASVARAQQQRVHAMGRGRGVASSPSHVVQRGVHPSPAHMVSQGFPPQMANRGQIPGNMGMMGQPQGLVPQQRPMHGQAGMGVVPTQQQMAAGRMAGVQQAPHGYPAIQNQMVPQAGMHGQRMMRGVQGMPVAGRQMHQAHNPGLQNAAVRPTKRQRMTPQKQLMGQGAKPGGAVNVMPVGAAGGYGAQQTPQEIPVPPASWMLAWEGPISLSAHLAKQAAPVKLFDIQVFTRQPTSFQNIWPPELVICRLEEGKDLRNKAELLLTKKSKSLTEMGMQVFRRWVDKNLTAYVDLGRDNPVLAILVRATNNQLNLLGCLLQKGAAQNG